MFSDRDNIIGAAFLILMGVLAAILIRAIVAGERLTMDLPAGAGWVLAIAFFVLIFVGLRRGGMFGGGRGRSWPDPRTGGRSLWDRIRDRIRRR
jgi:hypothetical protein